MAFVPDKLPIGKFVPDTSKVAEVEPEVAASTRTDDTINRGYPGANWYLTPRGAAKPDPRLTRMVQEVGTEGGLATAGQVAGGFLAPATFGASVPILGALGGGAGNYLNQRRRIDAGEQKSIKLGELFAAAGTSAIPGGPLASGGKAILKEGVKQGVGGLAGKFVEKGIDEGRLPTVKEAIFAAGIPAVGGAVAQKMQGDNPGIQRAVVEAASVPENVKARTLKDAQDLGLVVVPSKAGGGKVGNQVESIGGKAALNQDVSLRNQDQVNAAIKEELGIPKNADVTVQSLKAIRKEEAAPYAEFEKLAADADGKIAKIEKDRFTASDPHELAVQKSDPATVADLQPLKVQSGADLLALRKARFARDEHFDAYRSSSDPAELTKALAARDEAAKLELRLEDAARAAGKPELADRLKAARIRIAKTYSAEEALNLGDANFDASKLGRQLDRGAPLSGNLEKIAKFQQAFPSAVTEGAKVPTPGVSKLNLPFALASGGGVYGASHSVPLALASSATSLVAPGVARSLLLSKPYQKAFAGLPLRAAAKADPDKFATAIRLFAQSTGQE